MAPNEPRTIGDWLTLKKGQEVTIKLCGCDLFRATVSAVRGEVADVRLGTSAMVIQIQNIAWVSE